MVNIYDTANQLANDLKQIDQYKALEASIASMKQDSASMDLYHRMDELQGKIMSAQQSGQPLSEELKKEYQQINEEVEANEYLKDMITKEQAVFQVINEVQQAFTKPLTDLYDNLKLEDK
ncbi:cell fate (sporulation/competence/biofilm development) regulator YlbF (YheA/YmcA/DUF963 family) [Lactobacillus colini]|uniref:UPF0342 protein J2Z60_001440 n=1 Tax=Lactobacillus colini TaxID=1819254 RepID=A0ABS4MF14_9LACO|nr:YlbF family regulator [Lactobacillus colini]MBP2058263.1 cell fate (sporulation/competence/biofilm development) regulator YlbF (YheA/YmcA/DUF963 family) [Lactobacillus colini]